MKWPLPLNDVEKLHQKWLSASESRMEKYHPKYFGLGMLLSRSGTALQNRVESTARYSASVHCGYPY